MGYLNLKYKKVLLVILPIILVIINSTFGVSEFSIDNSLIAGIIITLGKTFFSIYLISGFFVLLGNNRKIEDQKTTVDISFISIILTLFLSIISLIYYNI